MEFLRNRPLSEVCLRCSAWRFFCLYVTSFLSQQTGQFPCICNCKFFIIEQQKGVKWKCWLWKARFQKLKIHVENSKLSFAIGVVIQFLRRGAFSRFLLQWIKIWLARFSRSQSKKPAACPRPPDILDILSPEHQRCPGQVHLLVSQPLGFPTALLCGVFSLFLPFRFPFHRDCSPSLSYLRRIPIIFIHFFVLKFAFTVTFITVSYLTCSTSLLPFDKKVLSPLSNGNTLMLWQQSNCIVKTASSCSLGFLFCGRLPALEFCSYPAMEKATKYCWLKRAQVTINTNHSLDNGRCFLEETHETSHTWE